MNLDLKNLPDDPVLLKQIIIMLVDEIQHLKEEITLLKKQLFGKSSEKNIKATQSKTEVVTVDNNTNNEALGGKDKKQPKRQKLPDHLPREQVTLDPPSICPECGGSKFRTIDQDTSEVLEYVPSTFKVIRYIRPRCACTNCEKIVQAYPPSLAISKGKAGSGLLAHVLIQKYCNHLPMYRQSQIYARESIDLPRSTLSSWAIQCSTLLEPLVAELRKTIFSSSHIHGDDTTVKVLAPGTGKTKVGRIWTYVRDGRSYSDKTPPAVCYFYSPDRKGERPREHLENFKGTLHADAYSGYDKLYESNTIDEAACWAHTRRKFYEITIASNNAKIANATLEQMGKIYQIEASIKGLAPEDRLKARQEKSKKLVKDLFTDFKTAVTKLPKQSATRKAINYAVNNQVALMRFLEDGKIQIDNNIAERAMRGVAVGRKNWLFAGSDEGGRTAANIYSLIETAKLIGVNPQLYMARVLDIIQDYNSSKLAELLPWNLLIPNSINTS